MSIADEIRRLHELHQAGALTDAEFEAAKAKLIAGMGKDVPPAAERAAECIGRLRRSRTDRWIAGVCGGLSISLGIESWVVRLLFVLFTLLGFGFGIAIYALAWIFVPEEARQ